jgi:hypothetical protein
MRALAHRHRAKPMNLKIESWIYLTASSNQRRPIIIQVIRGIEKMDQSDNACAVLCRFALLTR